MFTYPFPNSGAYLQGSYWYSPIHAQTRRSICPLEGIRPYFLSAGTMERPVLHVFRAIPQSGPFPWKPRSQCVLRFVIEHWGKVFNISFRSGVTDIFPSAFDSVITSSFKALINRYMVMLPQDYSTCGIDSYLLQFIAHYLEECLQSLYTVQWLYTVHLVIAGG